MTSPSSSILQNSIILLLAQGERLNAVLAEICDSLEEKLPNIKAAILDRFYGSEYWFNLEGGLTM